jgi:hypothetical protein
VTDVDVLDIAVGQLPDGSAANRKPQPAELAVLVHGGGPPFEGGPPVDDAVALSHEVDELPFLVEDHRCAGGRASVRERHAG